MAIRTRADQIISALVTASAILTGTGCGSSPTTGPVRSDDSQGRPAVTNASIISSPGVPADGTVTVYNHSTGSARLLTVSAVPVPGLLTPQLADAGLRIAGYLIGSSTGWPPDSKTKTVPAAGADLKPGYNFIIYGLTGSQVGRYYAIAGLRITYSYQGETYSIIAWSGFTACFMIGQPILKPGHTCAQNQSVSDQVNRYIVKAAGLS